MKKPTKPFNEEEFLKMKELQRLGKNTMDLSRIFNRSTSTTSFVSRSNTFQEYGQLVRRTQKAQPSYHRHNSKKEEYLPQHIDSVILQQVNNKLDNVLEILSVQTEQLKLIPKRRKF